MRVLITGANGQLGVELQKVLREGRAEIGSIPSAYNNAEVTATDSDVLDITNESLVRRYVSAGGFDLIVNCAAMTNVDGCEQQEVLAHKINAIGPANLADAAQAVGAKLVQISTDYVFSGDVFSDRTENDKPSPRSAYGRTKLAGEREVAIRCEKYFIVRTAWLYGYSGKNFVKTMIELAKRDGAIKVVYDQYGNPTSANDLAYEILKIAATNDFGIYHCTNNGTCSWCDFACTIVDAMGIPCAKTPCTTEEFPRPAKRPAYSSLRNKRLQDSIGDEMRPWNDALSEFIRNLSELED